MRGAKALDGKRVRILFDAKTKVAEFTKGDVGTFTKCGVVRCTFETDDGRRLDVGKMQSSDFEVIEEPPCPMAR
jgi:hypothetical protein